MLFAIFLEKETAQQPRKVRHGQGLFDETRHHPPPPPPPLPPLTSRLLPNEHQNHKKHKTHTTHGQFPFRSHTAKIRHTHFGDAHSFGDGSRRRSFIFLMIKYTRSHERSAVHIVHRNLHTVRSCADRSTHTSVSTTPSCLFHTEEIMRTPSLLNKTLTAVAPPSLLENYPSMYAWLSSAT